MADSSTSYAPRFSLRAALLAMTWLCVALAMFWNVQLVAASLVSAAMLVAAVLAELACSWPDSETGEVRQRFLFWSIVCAASATIVFVVQSFQAPNVVYEPQISRAVNAFVDELKGKMGDEPRFANVSTDHGTFKGGHDGHVRIEGTVPTAADLVALKALIDETSRPSWVKPVFAVEALAP